ncbi:hypothetical protein MK489_07920 [Myxococcota bacterium]|nr:hypothetical protein [Myxococcota bacterium]
MTRIEGLGLVVALAILAWAPPSSAQFPDTAAYPPAAEDPRVDGAFSSPAEYKNANVVRDDLDVGDFYKQHRTNWTVGGITYKDTITFFDNHHFTDPAYTHLDDYDMNSWKYAWGGIVVETWVFLPGNHPDQHDHYWIEMSGIGTANYPDGIDDDGGFLVRLNEDPSTDRFWRPGDPEPGEVGWDFADYYGVFARGGFNASAWRNGIANRYVEQEIYEWSITMNQVAGNGGSGSSDGDGGIPGVPQFSGGGGGGEEEENPIAPGICDPIWELRTRYKEVKDWKPSMGGHGTLGGTGWIPIGDEWVFMGWDDSMHPVPPEKEIEPIDALKKVEGLKSVGLGEVTDSQAVESSQPRRSKLRMRIK